LTGSNMKNYKIIRTNQTNLWQEYI
jgi:hypothetical protein